MLNNYISTTEAAHILSVSRITIFNWIQNKVIQAKKIGRNFAVSREEIEQMKEKGFILEKDRTMIKNFSEHMINEYNQVLRQL
jgi:excisionase family DNA binding protein